MCVRALVVTLALVAVAALVTPAPAAAQKTYRVYDTFTDSADRYLQNHQPDISPSGGANWRYIAGQGRTIVTRGIAASYGGTAPVEGWTYYTEMRDADVAVDVTAGSQTPHGGLILRWAEQDQYFRLDVAGPSLYRRDGSGSETLLARGTNVVHAGERHRLESRFEGNAIDVYFDGAFQFRAYDWTYYTGVNHGFYFDAASDPAATFDNFEITYLVPVPPCEYTVSPLIKNISADKMTGTVSVSTRPDCEWHVWSNDDFITAVEHGGFGSGTVTYGVENSTSSTARTGTISIANQSFTVHQAALVRPPSSGSSLATTSAASRTPQYTIVTTVGGTQVVWVALPPDGKQAGDCRGNCGLGCGGVPNPCGGNGDYWSNALVSAPEYVADDYNVPVCVGGVLQIETYQRYRATGQWTFHGITSDLCQRHDAECRSRFGSNWFTCLLAAFVPPPVDLCVNAHSQDWSYLYEAIGRSESPVSVFQTNDTCLGGF